MKNKLWLLAFVLVSATQWCHAQYIAEVLAYRPAPGQFVNKAPWGVPSATNTIVGQANGTLTLGSFGGYVVFRFENPVENHPDNPFGVDFTIFGNPLPNWSEPGIVSVMQDANGNGLPDDTWYELAGSDHYFPETRRNAAITYTNPKSPTAANVPWRDNLGNTGSVLANAFNRQPYYPQPDSFPNVGNDTAYYAATQLKSTIGTGPSGTVSLPRAFGYADNLHPLGTGPLTIPDNPYTPERENSGGDAFDISWAIDAKGAHVELPEIDFVRVQTGLLGQGGLFGNISTEIRGAVDVAPAPGMTGPTQLLLASPLPEVIDTVAFQLTAIVLDKGRPAENQAINWVASRPGASVSPEGVLSVTSPGPLTLIATLPGNPSQSVTLNTRIDIPDLTTGLSDTTTETSGVYPNPARSDIRLLGVGNATVIVF